MKIKRDVNGCEMEFMLTADEIRQAHEEFVFPEYHESVDSLKLSRRYTSCFCRYNVKTVTDLVTVINNGKILSFRNLGAVGIRAICRELDVRNIPYDRKNVETFVTNNLKY